MKQSAKVTIGIPVYNVNAYLEECLNSVANIKSNVEIIVIDDLGNENPWPIFEKFKADKRFKFLKNSKNIGQGKTRNRVIDMASKDSSHIFFLDSDDYIDPIVFDREFKKLNAGVHRVYKNLFRLKKTGVKEFFQRHHDNGFPTGPMGSFLVIKGLPKFWLTYFEDVPWTLLLSSANDCKFEYTDTLYFYRARLSSISHSSLDFVRMKDYIDAKKFLLEKQCDHWYGSQQAIIYEKYFAMKREARHLIKQYLPKMKKAKIFIIWLAIFFQKISFFNSWNVLINRKGFFK